MRGEESVGRSDENSEPCMQYVYYIVLDKCWLAVVVGRFSTVI